MSEILQLIQADMAQSDFGTDFKIKVLGTFTGATKLSDAQKKFMEAVQTEYRKLPELDSVFIIWDDVDTTEEDAPIHNFYTPEYQNELMTRGSLAYNWDDGMGTMRTTLIQIVTVTEDAA